MNEGFSLSGNVVRLRPVIESDREALIAIRSTEEVRRRWRAEDLDAKFTQDLAVDDVWRFTIEDRSGRIVGLVQFGEEDDPEYRHASIDIYIDPAVHRQGYATDAIQTLVEYLFGEREHHRLTIDPAADNKQAVACYAKIGFKPVGLMRAYERQSDGQWADGLLMDMLSTDRPG